jgi:hypothetical protein
LCVKLENLESATGNLIGVQKLCSSSLSDVNLNAIVDRLNSYPTLAYRQQFLEDIEPSIPMDHIGANVNRLNIPLLEAWRTVYDAISRGTLFKRDFQVLNAIVTVQNNPQQAAAFTTTSNAGNRRDMGVFLRQYQRARCNTCGNLGLAYMPLLHEIITNTATVFQRHNTTLGFAGWYENEVFASDRVIGGVLLPSFGADGSQHMIKYMAERSYTNAATNIDRPFGIGAAFPAREYDIFINVAGSPIRYIEFKSYLLESPLRGTDKSEQLRSYLSLINDMSELRYVLNNKKTSLPDAKVKVRNELFKGRDSTAIFDVIWNNIPLRNSLWVAANYPGGVLPTRNVAQVEYRGWLDALDNRIFIIVDVN